MPGDFFKPLFEIGNVKAIGDLNVRRNMFGDDVGVDRWSRRRLDGVA